MNSNNYCPENNFLFLIIILKLIDRVKERNLFDLFIVVFLIFIIKIYEKRGIRIINGYIIKKKINIHLLIQRILNNLNNKHYIYQKFEIRKKEETENILILLKIHGGLNNVYLSLLQLYNEPLIIHIGMDRPNKDLLVFWRNMITQILLSK